QLRMEASLLADLLAEPLEEILRHAADVREAEWLADFRHRYQDKAIIFEGEVRRGSHGKAVLAYYLPGDARLVIDDLNLFRTLSLEQPKAWIFGARLASVRLEAPGPRWIVRLAPESGV